MNKSLLFVVFILLSLMDYSNVNIVLATLLMALASLPSFRTTSSKVIILALSLFFICAELVRYLYNSMSSSWFGLASESGIFGLTASILIGCVFSFLFYSYISNNVNFKENSVFALKLALFVNILLFYSQFFLAYAFDTYIDYYDFFMGQESRYLNYFSSSVFKYRCTGLYVEPSTYAGIMAVLLVLYLNLSQARARMGIIFLVIFSIFLTFSNAAIIIGMFLVLGVFFYFTNGRYFLLASVLILICVGGFVFVYIGGLLDISSSLDYIISIRLGFFEYLLGRDDWSLYFGTGLFSIEQDLWMLSSGEGLDRVASLNDLGIIGVAFTRFGFLGLLSLAFSYFLLPNKKTNTFNFIAVLSTKMTIFFPIFMLVYISFYIKKGRCEIEES